MVTSDRDNIHEILEASLFCETNAAPSNKPDHVLVTLIYTAVWVLQKSLMAKATI